MTLEGEWISISTHTLTWSVTIIFVNITISWWISTHTLTWSVTRVKMILEYIFVISTHTLTWSVTLQSSWRSVCHRISTHTLTWSVTRTAYRSSVRIAISTHTLTWSVTTWGIAVLFIYVISTHTLTWSVTDVPAEIMKELTDFNSHAHVERDLQLTHRLRLLLTFQLTRSRGAWRPCRTGRNWLWHFNSHAHVERDTDTMAELVKYVISTHTLTWSVTTLTGAFFIPKRFQLTRSRGAWRRRDRRFIGNGHFNSHAHVERDRVVAIVFARKVYFNSHAHVERDVIFTSLSTRHNYFNSHAHVERDSVCIYKRGWNWISTHTLTWSVTSLQKMSSFQQEFQLTRSRGAWL